MKIFVIAGEPSGDKLGASLMAGLKSLVPDVEFHGIGGPLMQAEGLESLFPMSDLSVMGLAEILPRLPALFRRRDEAVAACLDLDPAALITIDSPDFCLRVARRVKAARNIPTIHYVAPTVWAWRPKRAVRMRGVIDHVLALLPFEPPYMERAGLGCDFVGHPVVSEPIASDDEAAMFRRELNLGDAPLLLALPGSRGGEVSRLLPTFGTAAATLHAQIPQLRVVIPTLAGVADQVAEATATWTQPPILLDPRDFPPDEAALWKRAAFRAADLALAASGTVSLELAANDTPMIIAYDMNWLTRQIMARMLRVDTVTLVNLVSETRTVPEYLGADCTPDKIAGAVLDLMGDSARYTAQLDAFKLTMERLGQGGEHPGLRAARAVLRVVT